MCAVRVGAANVEWRFGLHVFILFHSRRGAHEDVFAITAIIAFWKSLAPEKSKLAIGLAMRVMHRPVDAGRLNRFAGKWHVELVPDKQSNKQSVSPLQRLCKRQFTTSTLSTD